MRPCMHACTVFEKLFQKVNGENVSLARKEAFVKYHDFEKILPLSLFRPFQSVVFNTLQISDL